MGETDMGHKSRERSCVSTGQLQVVTSPYVRELLAEVLGCCCHPLAVQHDQGKEVLLVLMRLHHFMLPKSCMTM